MTQNYFILLTGSVDKEFRQGTAQKSCCASTGTQMVVAAAPGLNHRTCIWPFMWLSLLKGWRLNSKQEYPEQTFREPEGSCNGLLWPSPGTHIALFPPHYIRHNPLTFKGIRHGPHLPMNGMLKNLGIMYEYHQRFFSANQDTKTKQPVAWLSFRFVPLVNIKLQIFMEQL